MAEEIKAKFNFINREPINAVFNMVENEPIKAIFKIDPPSLNYDLLFNKPQINSVELIGNKSLSDLGIIQAITDSITLHNTSQEAHPYIRGLITAEETARIAADTTLQTNINNEASARASADTTLQNNINAEAGLRLASDNVLDGKITTEKNARIAADSAEVTARENADTDLGNRITAEVNARTAADTAIMNSIGNGKLTLQKNGVTVAEFTANQKGNTTANILSDTTAWGTIGGNIYQQTDLVQYVNTRQPNLTAANAGEGISITGSGSNVIISNTRTSAEWGNITGTLSDQTDLQNALDLKATVSALTTETTNRTNADTALQGQITTINNTISGYGNIVTHNVNEFATAAQGALADTSIQPNDNITELTNNAGYITKAVNNLDNYMLTTDINTALGTKVDKNNAITGATKTKITYDSKGLITTGTDLIESDIPNLHLSKISDVTSTAAEVNYLSGATSNIQGQINLKLNISDVIDNVNTTTSNQALSANMGKELSDRIQNIANIGKYLSNWNAPEGLATTVPQVIPYQFITGMYFVISVVAEAGGTNYRPEGSTYTGEPSTTVETEEIKVGDFYIYDGTSWSLLKNTGVSTIFSNIGGSPYDNSNLASALNAKVTGNNAITGATKCKITYDSKGLVTAGTDLSASDIPNLTLSKISDVTATASELNILDGATITTTELNYVDGVTSNIQTQLNSKAIPSDIKDGVLTVQKNGTNVATFSANQSTAQTANIIVPTKISDLTDDTSTNPIDKADTLTGLTATVTELNYIDGVTSNIQTQLNNKITKNVDITGATHTKITYDSKGLVTSGTNLAASDIPDISATYYLASNPSGYQANILEGVQINSTDLTITNKKVNIPYGSSSAHGVIKVDNTTIQANNGVITAKSLDGLTASITELNYTDGVTSNIQTQLNGKQASLGFTPENVTNKVTSISLSSTNTQYPSAKCVYDNLATKSQVIWRTY